jgi:hypothetical protein
MVGYLQKHNDESLDIFIKVQEKIDNDRKTIESCNGKKTKIVSQPGNFTYFMSNLSHRFINMNDTPNKNISDFIVPTSLKEPDISGRSVSSFA